jgi:phosphoribosylformimino-5-aminoimidazole carboxamide ribotide isomerase
MSGAPFATRTEVVPVLDLRGGLVVRARAEIRRGAVHDRIEVGDVEPARRPGGEQSAGDVGRVDAGFSSEAGVTAFLASGLGRPVLGSESQVDDARSAPRSGGAPSTIASRSAT